MLSIILFIPTSHNSEVGSGLAWVSYLSSCLVFLPPPPQTVLGVAVLADGLFEGSSIDGNVRVIDLSKEEPVLRALQSGIWNCENLEGCNRHLAFLCSGYSLSSSFCTSVSL